MENLYIKFKEWDTEDLKRACDIAESLGYGIRKNKDAIKFEWNWLLVLSRDWFYNTPLSNEDKIKDDWYREHVQEKERNIYVIFWGNKTPTKEHFSLSSAEEEAKRLCKKENKPFYVCKILAKYENMAILSDNINL